MGGQIKVLQILKIRISTAISPTGLITKINEKAGDIRRA
ncbi:hypothetical protein GPLA_0051 [Paraglaciecola polaris LMG 21857]|uniref:Uncharacterized protein n=1 Tax=Paraglaciecola polaris LMG 21857 TaxID=1129793 RepID=K6ZKX4_9ALTE|nr:hypothetical protein GPLA_0051 [Paraglaciecola polaris LMG 21857]